MLRSGRRCGSGMAFKGPGQIHGRLEVLGLPQLHVDLNVLRKAAHEQLRLLGSGEVPSMIEHRIEAFGVVLYRGGEGQASKFG